MPSPHRHPLPSLCCGTIPNLKVSPAVAESCRAGAGGLRLGPAVVPAGLGALNTPNTPRSEPVPARRSGRVWAEAVLIELQAAF